MPFIVLEGSDEVGKSTTSYELVKIAASHGWPVYLVHHVRGDSTSLKVWEDIRFVEAHQHNTFIIFDRWFYSELVYSVWEDRTPDIVVTDQMLDAINDFCQLIIFDDETGKYDALHSHATHTIKAKFDRPEHIALYLYNLCGGVK